MAIPISYNLRNLFARKTTTLMTALGIALSVAILVASLALVAGLRAVFSNTGNPLQLLVLRKGGNSELGSQISDDTFAVLRSEPGIAADSSGQPLASEELVNVANLPSQDDPNGMNVTVRGVTQTGMEMRPVRVVQGQWFRSGLREVVVGRAVAQRYPSAKMGNSISFGAGKWKIVGIMDAGQSAVNSEIWGDFHLIAGDYNRQGSASSVLLRARSKAGLESLQRAIAADPRLEAKAMTEKAYYESQTSSGAPLEFLGIFVAVIMSIGSGFAAANTMYAAVARRTKEIGTLRTLGFSPSAILLSFLSESVLLAGLAGALGCLLALPLDFFTTGVGSTTSFSEISFRFHVGAPALAGGLGLAIVLGALGGVWPARTAAKKEIISALREG